MWLRRYWDEENTWFYFELDPEGWVTRQVEMRQPDNTPIAATSLQEWTLEQKAGRIGEYVSRYGQLAEKPIEDDEIGDYEPIPAAEFEQLWQTARSHLEGKPSA